MINTKTKVPKAKIILKGLYSTYMFKRMMVLMSLSIIINLTLSGTLIVNRGESPNCKLLKFMLTSWKVTLDIERIDLKCAIYAVVH